MLPDRCEGQPRGRETRACHQMNKDTQMEETGKKKRMNRRSTGPRIPAHFWGSWEGCEVLVSGGGYRRSPPGRGQPGFPWWLGEAKT